MVTRSVQWVCQAINKSSVCLFYPKELKRQICLAYACCMKPGCSEMIQSVSPHRAARNTSLLHHSLLTTHYHTDTMLTSSFDVLRTLWCRLCMQKFGEVKFRKDRVKIQIWGKPVIFSHELCLYITRFQGGYRSDAANKLHACRNLTT